MSGTERRHRYRAVRADEPRTRGARAAEESRGIARLSSDPGQRADMRPLYLDVRGEPMLCLFHPAEGLGPGVLLCPPFGWEEIASYRSRFEWAESLAEAGMPTLRFDLPGTGDSAGSPEDPERFESWIDAVGVAVRFLRSEARRPRIAVIGIGLGGLLALAAAADGASVDDLVLWGVPKRGKALVRELATFARIESALIGAAGAPEPPPSASDAIAPGGFVLPVETMRALERFDVANLHLAGWEGRRALLLGRDGVAPDPELLRELQERGLRVDVTDGHGYSGMLTQAPEASRLPSAVRERVLEWLQAPASEAAVSGIPLLLPSASVVSAEAELSVGETRLRETPLSVLHEGKRLVGILSERVDAPPEGLALVLLNAGAVRRHGPGRLWVTLARRWAARGVPTFRVDLDGIGDASGDLHGHAGESGLYAREYVDQVRAILDELVERGTAQRFVLFGLCSGAYWAFHTALVDDRASLALMLNCRLLFWTRELEMEIDARSRRSKILQAGSWRKVLRGDARSVAWRVLVLTSRVVAEPFRLPARIRAHAKSRVAIGQAFDQLQASSTRAVFAFCEGEPLRDDLAAAGLLDRLDHWPHIELVGLPGRDHILRPLWMHEHLFAAVDDAVASELVRVPADRPAISGE